MNEEQLELPGVEAPATWDVSDDDLKQLRQQLRLRFPTDFPVKFRSATFKDGCWGDTELKIPKKEGASPYILIRVNRDMPRALQWIVTLHEYAHARQQRGPTVENHRLADHDGEWGVAEADLWNEFGG